MPCISVAGATLILPSPAAANPNDEVPPLAIAARETFDVFAVPAGTDPGLAMLNKLQVSATLRGDQIGLSGWSLHAQIIRFDGQSLSKRLGDVQTADNIEAVPFTRLFEAYLARLWGTDARSVAVRAGLIDLNSQFDSIDPASLMINSSHGIAPDLSHSGLSGPSIYPVTGVGATATWVQSPAWTFRLGLFDGVSGDPAHPQAFFAERLSPHDGVMLIGQADWQLTKNSRLEAGSWAYSAATAGRDGRKSHDRGVYASYEAPLEVLPRLTFWVRGGIANGHAQSVAGYLGGGVVQQGTLLGRTDDRIGLAIAHAVAGDSLTILGAHKAETSIELTYQARISSRFVIQPDLEFVRHPAAAARAPDSVGIGVRLVFAGAYPLRMAASDPGDPTVPPDGSSPAPDNGKGSQ